MTTTGKSVRCETCDGKGVVASWSFDGPMPDECGDCGGSGRNWLYPSGLLARYYSGPLLGRTTLSTATREQP